MHIKKSKMPKTWPVPRKGDRYVSVPSHSTSKGISLIFLIRDVLKLAKTRKEVRIMTLRGDVKVNSTVRKDEDFPVQVFDVVSFDKANLSYRLEIANKKFNLVKISGKEIERKIVKISGKKILGKNLVQMNLDDGQNFLSKEKFSVGDSAIVNTKDKKVEKILPLKEGANIEVILGKHAGNRGKLVRFEKLSRGKNYIVKLKDGETSLPFKTLLVIE